MVPSILEIEPEFQSVQFGHFSGECPARRLWRGFKKVIESPVFSKSSFAKQGFIHSGVTRNAMEVALYKRGSSVRGIGGAFFLPEVIRAHVLTSNPSVKSLFESHELFGERWRTTKMDRLVEAFHVLGKRLELRAA